MDLLADLRAQVSGSDNPLREKTFSYLINLMGCRDQLRINHWQTTSYAEHNMTDGFSCSISGYIDSIGEATLGLFGRPTITSQSNMVTDINMLPSKSVIDKVQELTCEMLAEYKVTEHEGLISLLGDFDADIKKYKFLSTLE